MYTYYKKLLLTGNMDLQKQGACHTAIYFQVVSIEQGQFIFYVKIPSQVVSDTFLRPLEP